MKYIKYLLFIALLLQIISPRLRAQVGLDKVAQSTMNFQLVGISPKASAMGGAYVALCDGAEAMFYNPAGVADMKQPLNVTMNMTNWIADIDYIAGAIAWNLRRFGTIGFSALAVDYGTVHGTSLVHPNEKAAYPLGYRDDGEVNNVGAYSIGLTYSRAVSSQFYIGANARVVGQNLGENMFYGGDVVKNNATKLVFDAGVKYYTGFKDFRFGMAIRNFSSNLKREEISEQLPLLFTMGLAIDMMDLMIPSLSQAHKLTFALDFLHSNSYSERINWGVEYLLWRKLALRGGYQSNQDLASWSLGAGFNSSIGDDQFEFNYSYSKFDLFDAVTRFSIAVSF
ncbi:PorV/PorQ family protein [candidate division KSB1 bacterium]|nr:PorV/PorQ family protein [candidate division KSB1 bacterium]